MPKKINCLIFSDFEIPNYDRPYRGVLFLEWSDSSKYNFLIVSPFTNTKFKTSSHNIETYYYKNDQQIKKKQYNFLFRLKNIGKLFLSLIKLKIKNKEIDLVYAGTTYTLLFAGLFKKNNTKIIANVCDFYSDLYRGYKMPLGQILKYPIKWVEMLALSFADVITVDTFAQRSVLSSKYYINQNKCVVLPNGLILEKFPYLAEKDESVMRKYGFKKDDIVFFYGGDISEDDGIELILRYASDNQNKENFKFFILGKGNSAYINKLLKQITELGLSKKIIIDSFKPIDELYKYISVTDICLAPFKVTDTTNVTEVAKIISYLLGGKRVVSTRAEGVCSLYGDHVTYFKDLDYNDFKSKVTEVVNKIPTREGKLKIRKHGEKFDFKSIIDKEYEIVNRLLLQNSNFEDLNFKV